MDEHEDTLADGWREDGCFHYTGEGQYGDQQMKSGNAAILNHADAGRALRVFMGARGVVAYEDEFELDPEQPYYYTDAPETKNGPVRSVIVFRLRPKTITPRPPNTRIDQLLRERVEDVPIEEQNTERYFVAPSHEVYEAERREQREVRALEVYLRKKRHEVFRLKIVPPGEAKPLFCDLIDRTTNTLVEAKGSWNEAPFAWRLVNCSTTVDSSIPRRRTWSCSSRVGPGRTCAISWQTKVLRLSGRRTAASTGLSRSRTKGSE
jgi:hypothetical protein